MESGYRFACIFLNYHMQPTLITMLRNKVVEISIIVAAAASSSGIVGGGGCDSAAAAAVVVDGNNMATLRHYDLYKGKCIFSHWNSLGIAQK